MYISEAFASQLASEFDRQIRIRWSPAFERFVVERKGRRKRDLPLPSRKVKIDPDVERLQKLYDMERWIQERDGYYRVLEVAPGDRTPCKRCRAEIKLERKSFRAPKCAECGMQDLVMFVPLNDELLEVLRWSDPDRGGLERVEKRDTKQETARVVGNKRRFRNQTEAIWKEDFNRVFGIQSVGYTGREAMWNA